MSAAGSDLAVGLAHEKGSAGIDTPRHNAAPGSALDDLISAIKPGEAPIIAVDMDDVLSQTNEIVAKCMYAYKHGFYKSAHKCRTRRAQRGLWNQHDYQ